MSAERSARSVSHTDGVDKVRALQRVLYRSAKHDPQRRFHALYDKIARSDILWQAWVDVATNGAEAPTGAAGSITGGSRPSGSTGSPAPSARGVRMHDDERCRRAVCGRTARTVRRAGTARAVSDPYRFKNSLRLW